MPILLGCNGLIKRSKMKNEQSQSRWLIGSVRCGKRGIRTLGTRKGTTVFETVPIDHSGIFPRVCRF